MQKARNCLAQTHIYQGKSGRSAVKKIASYHFKIDSCLRFLDKRYRQKTSKKSATRVANGLSRCHRGIPSSPTAFPTMLALSPRVTSSSVWLGWRNLAHAFSARVRYFHQRRVHTSSKTAARRPANCSKPWFCSTYSRPARPMRWRSVNGVLAI